MDFSFTPEQESIRTLANEFARLEMKDQASHWDEAKIFPEETLRRAASLGFASIYIQADVGGSQLSHQDAVIVFEELAGACPSTTGYLSVHNMVSSIVDTYGTIEQRRQWLPSLVSMQHFASYCLTEPNSGSDAAALQTRAVKKGGDYVLNGTKAFISGGSRSDVYCCMVRTSADKHKGISCLMIEKDTPGLSFGKKEDKLGWHSQPMSSVFFQDCHVPIHHRIGEEGQGFPIAITALNSGRVNIAACSIGAAKACLDVAKNYVKERAQFNQPLFEFQTIQFKLANMATDLEAARLMVYRAAHAVDSKHPDVIMLCAMAKKFATDMCFKICDDALQLHGGYGYLREYVVERFVRDVRVHRILEGTNEIMQQIIAKKMR